MPISDIKFQSLELENLAKMNYSIREAFGILYAVLIEIILIWLLFGLPCLAQEMSISNTLPGNALMATATDIAHFVIAHLQNGRYGETRILNEATAQEMHRQHFAHYPDMAA